MYHYRQVLVRMRQGDTDREIARSGLLGRRNAGTLRARAAAQGWLEAGTRLPADDVLARVLARPAPLPATCVSSLEPLRSIITPWFEAGVQGTTIHAALVRNHGYQGSYSAVRRFLKTLAAARGPQDATCRLSFSPGEAAQIDFGAGPVIIDVMTGEVIKTWFFVMTLCWSRHQY
ncbi:MAG: IS21 family transposase, partial [Nevskia sp.]|nr:IS21 family transposase [Nevskia sp.]